MHRLIQEASKRNVLLADGRSRDVEMYTVGVWGKNNLFAGELAKYTSPERLGQIVEVLWSASSNRRGSDIATRLCAEILTSCTSTGYGIQNVLGPFEELLQHMTQHDDRFTWATQDNKTCIFFICHERKMEVPCAIGIIGQPQCA